MEDTAEIYVSFFNISFNNIMMRISSIYVSITGYLLQENNIHYCSKIVHHSMLDDYDYIKQQLY